MASSQKQTLGQLRKARGMSREELAVATHTTYSHLVRIEQGRQEPYLATARRIAAHLGVAVEEIAWPEVRRPKVPAA